MKTRGKTAETVSGRILKHNVEREAILSKLSGISIFEELKGDPAAMNAFVDYARIKSYPAGAVIIREGESGAEMFIVYSGCVEIQKKTRAGDSYTVAVLKSEYNVFFGELALIDDDTRSATVIARENSVFLVISKDDFLDLGKKHPEYALPIIRTIAKSLAARLRKTTTDMLTIFDALVEEVKS